ncbi:signal peptidase I [Ruminococcus gauvreauii]|uniref:Signal peptidase I n=1 Tax=Ruminococcus gauvreauii TaxID=438033 RepID=A0ABY5VNG5_9FIRM|nr:signal peptidase I [Ruminococcus gauvreauii]UWP60918.1 signal peptidase I [Ruminococcus gauvreauii]
MKKIYKAVTTILLVALIALVAALFLPRVFGLQPLAVLSGSMEPTYHVGSLIYVQDVDPADIEVGDPMTYTIGEGTMVTHRVVEKDEENQTFQTKGDANENVDGGAVAYSEVVGRPAFSIPLLGYVAVYAATRTGMIIMITAILVVLILTFLPDMLMGKDEKEDGGAK